MDSYVASEGATFSPVSHKSFLSHKRKSPPMNVQFTVQSDRAAGTGNHGIVQGGGGVGTATAGDSRSLGQLRMASASPNSISIAAALSLLASGPMGTAAAAMTPIAATSSSNNSGMYIAGINSNSSSGDSNVFKTPIHGNSMNQQQEMQTPDNNGEEIMSDANAMDTSAISHGAGVGVAMAECDISIESNDNNSSTMSEASTTSTAGDEGTLVHYPAAPTAHALAAWGHSHQLSGASMSAVESC
jgi:hypothetical protein